MSVRRCSKLNAHMHQAWAEYTKNRTGWLLLYSIAAAAVVCVGAGAGAVADTAVQLPPAWEHSRSAGCCAVQTCVQCVQSVQCMQCGLALSVERSALLPCLCRRCLLECMHPVLMCPCRNRCQHRHPCGAAAAAAAAGATADTCSSQQRHACTCTRPGRHNPSQREQQECWIQVPMVR